MNYSSENELKNLINIYLNVTNDSNAHLEPVYKIKDKYYQLKSISSCKNKMRRVCLIETDINGRPKCDNDIPTMIDTETFKTCAKIVGANKKGDRSK